MRRQEVGAEAERIVRGLRWRRPLIVIPGDTSNDFGIDATIELCEVDGAGNKTLTRRQVHVQIKGTDNPSRQVNVKASPAPRVDAAIPNRRLRSTWRRSAMTLPAISWFRCAVAWEVVRETAGGPRVNPARLWTSYSRGAR